MIGCATGSDACSIWPGFNEFENLRSQFESIRIRMRHHEILDERLHVDGAELVNRFGKFQISVRHVSHSSADERRSRLTSSTGMSADALLREFQSCSY